MTVHKLDAIADAIASGRRVHRVFVRTGEARALLEQLTRLGIGAAFDGAKVVELRHLEPGSVCVGLDPQPESLSALTFAGPKQSVSFLAELAPDAFIYPIAPRWPSLEQLGWRPPFFAAPSPGSREDIRATVALTCPPGAVTAVCVYRRGRGRIGIGVLVDEGSDPAQLAAELEPAIERRRPSGVAFAVRVARGRAQRPGEVLPPRRSERRA